MLELTRAALLIPALFNDKLSFLTITGRSREYDLGFSDGSIF